MDEVEFHREPPSNIPTMVTAFGGWIDAGEAATDAHALPGPPARGRAARHDRPGGLRRFYPGPAGRAPDRRGRAHHPLAAECVLALAAARGGAGLLLFRGLEPQRRWRTYATLLLDVAARCGVQRIVSLGAVLAAVPHTRPPRVTGSSTDPAWHARFEAWGMDAALALRRPDRHCQRRVGRGAAPRHGVAHRAWAKRPIISGDATNPAVRQALLTAVARLLDLELDVSPLEAAVQAFRTRCDQAVAQDAATQAYVRQLEQAYDATGDETPRPRRDDDFNPEQLMHELEDFLRQERDGVRSDAPHGCPWRRQGRSTAIHGRFAHAQASPPPRRRRGKSPCDVA